MLTHYLILGLEPDADDAEIRERYLTLVKRFSPEKHPRRFQRISESYEAVKNRRQRVKVKLLGGMESTNYEKTIRSLSHAVTLTRRRPGFKELLEACDHA